MTEVADSKLRQMEEEMNRFEAEIANQTAATALAAPITGGFTFPTTATAFLPHQLRVPQQSSTCIPSAMLPVGLTMPPGISMYMPLSQPLIQPYQLAPPAPAINTVPVHPTASTIPTFSQVSVPSYHSNSTATATTTTSVPVIDFKAEANNTSSMNVSATAAAVRPTSVQKIISAAPQMAGPTELAARAREAAAAAAASKSKANDNDDDDVTRALLAAAAGVTYTRVQGSNGKEKVLASITKPPLTPVVAASQQHTSSATSVPAAPLTAQVVQVPMLPPPAYRSISTNAAVKQQQQQQQQQAESKKKRYIRIAAGKTWEDSTLNEWDPNDFRMFCGDLGNEANDDTLARAFNRYPSFQKARVVRDKWSAKSRGYGFVSFSDPNDFTRAMREMNGKYVGNRPIKLKRSDWKGRQLETHRKKEKEKRKLGLKT